MFDRKSISFSGKFFLCLLLCLGGGWLTGLVTEVGVKTWYPHLIKPAGTPPDLVFPIIWTILYVFMAISLTLLWTSPIRPKNIACLFFGIQLVLNFIWSYLFFYFQQPAIALVDIALLWMMIFLTVVSFWKHTHFGSLLFLPYLAWVTYAAYLNLFIWIYNSQG